MGQDFKCALGMHKLEIQDTLEVKILLELLV